MPDDKSLGKRLLGLFVEFEPRAAPAPSSDEPAADAVDRLARTALAQAQAALPASPEPAEAAPPPGPAPSAPPDALDFDAVFARAGLDAQALDRVKKAEALLQTLPDGASDEVKLQIVQAALAAFGFEVSTVVEAVDLQVKALEAYVRANEGQTAKAVAETQARLLRLDEQAVALKADIDRRTHALAALAAAAEVRRQQVVRVADFFRAPHPEVGQAPSASDAQD